MNLLALKGGDEIYVLGWGTFAIINAFIARGKNRNMLVWFLLSLLWGPFVTIVLVFFCSSLDD